MELLGGMLRALQQRTGVDTEQVADGVFGCVTQTGEQGGNIGKSACLLAGCSADVSGQEAAAAAMQGLIDSAKGDLHARLGRAKRQGAAA